MKAINTINTINKRKNRHMNNRTLVMTSAPSPTESRRTERVHFESLSSTFRFEWKRALVILGLCAAACAGSAQVLSPHASVLGHSYGGMVAMGLLAALHRSPAV